MDNFLLEELRKACRDIISVDISCELISKVVEAYDKVVDFSFAARKEGLLFLEEKIEKLDKNDETEEIFYNLIRLVTDGTDPEIVLAVGKNMFVSRNMHSYQGLTSLLYIEGSLMIQAGDNPRIIEEYLKSMLPKIIVEEIEKREFEDSSKDNASKETTKETTKEASYEEQDDNLKKLCEEDSEINENDHSILSETARCLINLSDRDVQRLLRDTDNNILSVVLKCMPGKVRAKIFNNLSRRLAVMVANDVVYMGPVRQKDVEAGCVVLSKSLIKLEERGEIQQYDFSVLMVIVDIYKSLEQKDRELKEKYAKLESVIRKIYYS